MHNNTINIYKRGYTVKGIKFLLMLLGTCLILNAWSATDEKVLQNGLEGYNGCADAFIISKAGYETVNYGSADTLELRWDDG